MISIDDLKILIGRPVKYIDHLGLEEFGSIVAAEPYKDNIAWIYIENEDSELNIHTDNIGGKEIRYAALRPSDEVYLDTRDDLGV